MWIRWIKRVCVWEWLHKLCSKSVLKVSSSRQCIHLVSFTFAPFRSAVLEPNLEENVTWVTAQFWLCINRWEHHKFPGSKKILKLTSINFQKLPDNILWERNGEVGKSFRVIYMRSPFNIPQHTREKVNPQPYDYEQ